MTAGNKKGGKTGKKGGRSWQIQLTLIFVLLAGLAALSTTMLLLIGMLPTFVALFIDRTADKNRPLTVGAMNLAGCAPFILQLWTTGTSMNNALTIITDPRTIIVMYCAAGVGYIINWAVSGLVGSVMVQRGTSRRNYIARRQAELVERWGPEVTGETVVDDYGFAVVEDHTPDTKPETK